MNTSLTEFFASLLLLVAQTALPAISSGQTAQMELPEPRTETAVTAPEPARSKATRKRGFGHTPYYDFGRRPTRAKD